jgi:hypothetical protein
VLPWYVTDNYGEYGGFFGGGGGFGSNGGGLKIYDLPLLY